MGGQVGRWVMDTQSHEMVGMNVGHVVSICFWFVWLCRSLASSQFLMKSEICLHKYQRTRFVMIYHHLKFEIKRSFLDHRNWVYTWQNSCMCIVSWSNSSVAPHNWVQIHVFSTTSHTKVDYDGDIFKCEFESPVWYNIFFTCVIHFFLNNKRMFTAYLFSFLACTKKYNYQDITTSRGSMRQ